MSGSVVLFQFTHPGGVRRGGATNHTTTDNVSIHAPGRGATYARSKSSITCRFQFTHPGGVRRDFLRHDARAWSGFNSRTREGCDARALFRAPIVISFNSRTREGCDRMLTFGY